MRPFASQAERARALRSQPMGRRELVIHALVAVLFFAAAGALVACGYEGPVDVVDLVALVAIAATLERLDFEIGAGQGSPIQLALVPMLFVLPPAIVPLVVATAFALSRIHDIVADGWHPQRLLNVPGDAWFAVGPAVVFTVAGIDSPFFGDWPLYVLALAAQFACDLAGSLAREGIVLGTRPVQHLRAMGEVWLFDVLLSPLGLLAADASERHKRAYLLVLPVAVLLNVLARERRERINQAIELTAAYRGTALLLTDVLSDEDEYTGSHSEGVVAFAVQIAEELRVDAEERRLVEFGAMLHDIGKIKTPKEILHKPGPLDDDEWAIMRQHTIEGQRMLDRVGGALHDIGKIVRASHECYDGSGYPDGLAGAAIPRAARIVAVADAHSAMTTDRPYRAALPFATVVEELRRAAGTQFDPIVVEAALTVLTAAEQVAA